MTTRIDRTLLSTPARDWRVEQLIALDWYDGPLEGALRLAHPQCTLYFWLVADRATANPQSPRLFQVSELRPDGFERLLRAFGVHAPPHIPVWAPHDYAGPEDDARRQRELEHIQEEAIQLPVLVCSTDMVAIQEVWQVVPGLTLRGGPRR